MFESLTSLRLLQVMVVSKRMTNDLHFRHFSLRSQVCLLLVEKNYAFVAPLVYKNVFSFTFTLHLNCFLSPQLTERQTRGSDASTTSAIASGRLGCQETDAKHFAKTCWGCSFFCQDGHHANDHVSWLDL